MAKRPKTGEPRRTRQPLKIDKLPGEMHDFIQELRAEGWSWQRIEDNSPSWKLWEKVPTEVKRQFPKLKLPHANLQRWYDLRVEQVRAEILAKSETARKVAEVFKERTFTGIDEAVLNALRDQVFSLVMNARGDEKSSEKFTKELGNFAFLLSKLMKVQLDKKKLSLDEEKLQLSKEKVALMRSKILGLKGDAVKKKLKPEELKDRLDEIYGLAS